MHRRRLEHVEDVESEQHEHDIENQNASQFRLHARLTRRCRMLSARDTLYREETPRASALRCVELSSRFCRRERGRELFEAGTALRRLAVLPAARGLPPRLPRGKRNPRYFRGGWLAG